MKLAVLSGKGGTGKTFVSVNLAAASSKAAYIDCDVEEPNGHLFLKPQNVVAEDVFTMIPGFNIEKCIGCQFNSVLFIKDKPRFFPQLCHSCGGCLVLCPENAIYEDKKHIGVVETGVSGNVTVVTGILDTGEASGVKVISQALQHQNDTLIVIDCPPGSGCSVMESVMDSDYCVIVAEPTAFGLHNFKMVYELVTLLGKRCGVVINKETSAYAPLEQFCKDNNINILMRIPFSEQTASLCSAGKVAVREDNGVFSMFTDLLKRIEEEAEI